MPLGLQFLLMVSVITEGASSLFILSSSSSGSTCILQHYSWLAYTSSARGTLTSTLFLLDSEIPNFVAHKRCYEHTFRKRSFAVELRPQAVCYCLGPEVLSFLYFTGLGWQLCFTELQLVRTCMRSLLSSVNGYKRAGFEASPLSSCFTCFLCCCRLIAALGLCRAIPCAK